MKTPSTAEKIQPLDSTQRDIVILLLFLVAAVIFVLLFDTGSIADWVARHKDGKIDEIIVAGVGLTVSLGIFSVRRWLELKRHFRKYRELHAEMLALNRESLLLSELGDLLQSCLSPSEAHRLIVERSKVLFPGSSGAVCITSSSRDLVEAVAPWGQPALTEKYFPPTECWALRRGRVHELRSDSSLACGHIAAVKPSSAVCVPMMAHGETLGVLYLDSGPREQVQSQSPPPAIGESQIRLAQMVAERIALALANLNLREVLKSQSIRDPLTGLFNRRYMEESLERELRRAVRRQSSVGVMMIDIDHFKRFNDSFGHEAGDTLLREIAKVFKTQFRTEDIVCRYGGEEFTIILPDATLEETLTRAAQLCEVARGTVAQHRGKPLDPVTLSIGVSAHPDKGSTIEALLRAADSALYRAKEEGRDRVVLS